MSSKKKKEEKSQSTNLPSKPWLPMRKGIIIIAITSIAMVIFTMWQAVPISGWYEGALLGVSYGGMVWVVFLIMLLFYRITRR